jgi:hypothetical protein
MSQLHMDRGRQKNNSNRMPGPCPSASVSGGSRQGPLTRTGRFPIDHTKIVRYESGCRYNNTYGRLQGFAGVNMASTRRARDVAS